MHGEVTRQVNQVQGLQKSQILDHKIVISLQRLLGNYIYIFNYLRKDPICQIYAGEDSSYAVSYKGQLYAWGDVIFFY